GTVRPWRDPRWSATETGRKFGYLMRRRVDPPDRGGRCVVVGEPHVAVGPHGNRIRLPAGQVELVDMAGRGVDPPDCGGCRAVGKPQVAVPARRDPSWEAARLQAIRRIKLSDLPDWIRHVRLRHESDHDQ